MKKTDLIEWLDELLEIFEPVIMLLLSISLYLIINPDGLSSIVWDSNESITMANLIGMGIPLYLLFRLAEQIKPFTIFKAISLQIQKLIKTDLIPYAIAFIISFSMVFLWVYFMGLPPFQLKSSLIVAFLGGVLMSIMGVRIVMQSSSIKETEK